MSGRQVIVVLVAIVLATMMLPPVGAVAVNRARLQTATAVVQSFAQHLRDDPARFANLERSDLELCGLGWLPSTGSSVGDGWVGRPRSRRSAG